MSEDLLKRLRRFETVSELAQDAAARIEALEAKRDAAVMAEREACAAIAESRGYGVPENMHEAGEFLSAQTIAAEIRARSNKEPGQ